MKHELKCEAEYFDAVKRGEKLFEIRKNDRGYAVGDTIVMRRTANGEPHPYDLDGVFHGPLELIVTYMTDYAQKPGYVVLGVQKAVPVSTIADNATLRASLAEVEGENTQRKKIIADIRRETECPEGQSLRYWCKGLADRATSAEARVEKLESVLALIADTDPDEGTAWFHATADATLAECEEGK